jgi:hypothetical protein
LEVRSAEDLLAGQQVGLYLLADVEVLRAGRCTLVLVHRRPLRCASGLTTEGMYSAVMIATITDAAISGASQSARTRSKRPARTGSRGSGAERRVIEEESALKAASRKIIDTCMPPGDAGGDGSGPGDRDRGC